MSNHRGGGVFRISYNLQETPTPPSPPPSCQTATNLHCDVFLSTIFFFSVSTHQ
uniref:Uncharacterized protein n=1 Tax=Octopus bimaculoides TaxID=37653 RepID=A0A0L8HRI1_OCTBM